MNKSDFSVWYKIMGTGKLIKELNAWIKGYRLPYSQTISFQGPLPLDAKDIPSTTMVQVDFGQQKVAAHGFASLCDKLRKQTDSILPLDHRWEDAGWKFVIKRDTIVNSIIRRTLFS